MTKICKYCGVEFETDRNYQKYCSKSCYGKDYREQHQDYFKEYQRKYRQNHKDHLREYHRKYRQAHKDHLSEYYRKYNKEYRKQHRTKGPKKSRLNYPCFEYIGSFVDQIPTKMCLNCDAERCRFDND